MVFLNRSLQDEFSDIYFCLSSSPSFCSVRDKKNVVAKRQIIQYPSPQTFTSAKQALLKCSNKFYFPGAEIKPISRWLRSRVITRDICPRLQRCRCPAIAIWPQISSFSSVDRNTFFLAFNHNLIQFLKRFFSFLGIIGPK